jgi:cytochrome d ubiquinol oxidase subunit II
MATVFYVVLAFMITTYVVLDGFDLGIGALHRIVGRSPRERDEATGLIGPIWDGNEVWLIAGGGVLFLAFPRAYASAFSGLYFGLILVLWLLIGRGLAIELRRQLDHPLWTSACDTVFWLSSAALALVFGVALGNVVRGVPLGPDGYFHLTLFHILNWYALLIGLFGLVVLAAHGASFLAWRASAPLAQPAQRWARGLRYGELVLALVCVGPTYAVRSDLFTRFADHPWRLVFPALALGSLAALFVFQHAGRWGRAFKASCGFIVGLLATMAAGMYPYVLPAHEHRPYGLTIHNAATGAHALSIAIVWWAIALALAIVYFTVVYRLFFGRRPPGAPTSA